MYENKGAGKTAQAVVTLITKPDHLSSSPQNTYDNRKTNY